MSGRQVPNIDRTVALQLTYPHLDSCEAEYPDRKDLRIGQFQSQPVTRCGVREYQQVAFTRTDIRYDELTVFIPAVDVYLLQTIVIFAI
jgi:hypothetical protein